MSVKPRSVPTKTLAQNLSSSGTILYLNNTLDWDGAQLSSSDFGTEAFATLRNAANTQIEFVEIDPTTIDSNAAITITKRGLGYDGTRVASTETKYNWSAFDTYVELGADAPALLAEYAALDGNNSFSGVNSFTQPVTVPTPVNDTDAANKGWVATVVNGGAITVSQVVISGTCGENVVAGNLLYLKAADGKWWKTDADTAATVNNVQLGIAQGSGTADGSITGGVLIRGIDTNQSGGAAGSIGYASNTAGGISTSTGTVEKAVGNYITASTLAFDPMYYYTPTASQKAAMTGTGGTVSSTNRFATEDGVQVVQSRITEESASGITAGVPVFMQSDGEASKTATVKTFIATTNNSGIHKNSFPASGYDVDYISIAWLTENKFVAGFSERTGASAYEQRVAVGSITDDGQIAIWSTYRNLDGDDTHNLAGVYRLSDSKFIAVEYEGSSGYKIFVGSLDANNVITVGSAESTTSEDNLSIARLSDSSFISARRDAASDDCYITAYTVSGTTITAGSAVAFDAAASNDMKVIGLDSARGVAVWVSAGATLTSAVVNVSGTTVSAVGTTYNIESTNASNVFIDKISTDKIIIAYTQSTATDDTKCAVATISGDVITWGSAVEVHDGGNAGGECTGVVAFGGSNAIVSWIHATSNDIGHAFAYITISGTTPTVANTITISNTMGGPVNSKHRRVSAMVNGHFLVAGDGSAQLTETIHAFKPVFNEVLMGVAKSAPVSNVVPVIQKGRTGALYSSLTFGKKYLFNLDGTISETGVIPGGVAIGTTELLID